MKSLSVPNLLKSSYVMGTFDLAFREAKALDLGVLTV